MQYMSPFLKLNGDLKILCIYFSLTVERRGDCKWVFAKADKMRRGEERRG